MQAHLSGADDRKTRIITVAALVLAVLITIPGHAQAQTRADRQMLSEGIGMRGTPSIRVRTLQHALAHRGFGLGATGVDGRFGPMTAAAVRRFQTRTGLAADGIVGPRTRRALHLPVATRGSRSRDANRPAGSRDANRPAGAAAKQPDRTPPATRASGTSKPQPTPTVTTTTSRRTPEETNVTNPWILPIALGAAAAALIAIAAFLALAAARALRARTERRSAVPAPVFAPDGAADTANTDTAPDVPIVLRDGRPRAVLTLVPDPDRSSEVVLLGGPGHEQPASGERVIGYVPASPRGGAPPGSGLTETIEAACRACGWDLIDVVTEADERSPQERLALVAALERVDRGEAGAVVVAHADHIRRLNGHAAALSDWLREAGTGLIVQDVEPAPATGRHDRHAAVVMLDRAPAAAPARRQAQ